MSIAKVALDVPLDTLFDYIAPGLGQQHIGCRVAVPFGRRQQVGIVVEMVEESALPAGKLKPIGRLLDDTPLFPKPLLTLFLFCHRYYHYPLGEIMLNALPGDLRKVSGNKGKIECFRLSASGLSIPADALPKRAILKRRLLTALQQGEKSAPELLAVSAGFRNVLREFIAAGWVESFQQDDSTAPRPTTGNAEPLPRLTEEQAAAVDKVLHAPPGFRTWLLHGVTGSGKTEVYLRTIAPLIAANRQVLVLVPEINLTPQLEQKFRRRFPSTPIVMLHSALNDTERSTHWLQAQRGQANIVLGTRLAVFTPLPRLGLIIVDEEHDASFKQQEGFRYAARDVAITRAKQANIPILLGSATPALETYHNARQGRYQLLTLTQRAVESATLPSIRLLDMRHQPLLEGLSETLLRAIETRLQHGEQSLVFINRRGFAPVLLCGECGWTSTCPRCTSRLVLHLGERRLRCHHCGRESDVPAHCPDCGNLELKPIGHGTQRIEAALARRFPSARLLRFDRDSTRRKHALANMLEQVHSGEVDILIGTQMLAKGHDFPNLTLAAVLNADSALYSADFRASERLFAQLMQVAGRAGRAATPGEVLIQTQFPEHPLFQNLLRHDYATYAQTLLTERAQAAFPPFSHLALLRAEANTASAVLHFLQRARDAAPATHRDVALFDPVPSPMARLAGKERAQILVQSASRQALQRFLDSWLPSVSSLAGNRIRWSLDVDPQDL